jgi:hypothetical protein
LREEPTRPGNSPTSQFDPIQASTGSMFGRESMLWT